MNGVAFGLNSNFFFDAATIVAFESPPPLEALGVGSSGAIEDDDAAADITLRVTSLTGGDAGTPPPALEFREAEGDGDAPGDPAAIAAVDDATALVAATPLVVGPSFALETAISCPCTTAARLVSAPLLQLSESCGRTGCGCSGCPRTMLAGGPLCHALLTTGRLTVVTSDTTPLRCSSPLATRDELCCGGD